MLTLDTPIININRVGQTTAKRLVKIGITTVRDLLFYFPYRYDDYQHISKIDKLILNTSANIIGQIELIQNRRAHRRRMYITEALVTDETDSIKVIWFNQPFIVKNLKVGDKISLAGKVTGTEFDKTFVSPIYEKLTANPLLHTNRLVPNYHLTANITQKQIRFLIKQVIFLADRFIDWLPAKINKSQQLLNLGQAVKKIHFPENYQDVTEARTKLAFAELFLLQIQALMIKNKLQTAQAEKITFFAKETKDFVNSLPFLLTNSQRQTAWQILQDLKKDKPMSRLLQGDVGSGKTLVAVIAMLNVVLNKKQAILMAPTEILARQHFNTVNQLLKNFNIKIGLITSSDKKTNFELKIKYNKLNKKRGVIDSKSIIKNSDIIIGTHALIQENVRFDNLALAIIDEQHRFGVEQRSTLLTRTNANLSPHLLSMTATPIPRTLALTLYAELDLSMIREMPKDRKKIITKLVAENKRDQAYEFIRQQIKNGRQIFVICPLIDISDKLGVKSVKEEFVKLDKYIFPDIKIGLLHGQLKFKEKEEVMNKFLKNEIKILVATSVLEVGIDVPNATVMMIEGADRFGLAQLHQFRGRVGRSDHQSYCFLFTDSLPGQASDETAKSLDRLKALENCYDGFALAKMDLKFRGPGEIYGLAQKGFPQLKVASLFDYVLIKKAHEEATKLLEYNPDLSAYPLLKYEVSKLQKEVHLE